MQSCRTNVHTHLNITLIVTLHLQSTSNTIGRRIPKMLQIPKRFLTQLLRFSPPNFSHPFFNTRSFHLSTRHRPSRLPVARILARNCSNHPPPSNYIGVTYSPENVKKYAAELELDDKLVISGGEYWTAEDAARGYDELVDLYCDDDAPRNFGLTDAKALPAAEWSLPSGERHADLIPVIPNTYFTIDEVIQAVTREKGIDVRTLDLEGKSSLAKYMVFVTCRSQSHMRRLADMMIRSLKARNLNDDFEYAVEGRNCDDWMIADCNTIVIHFLREDTRRILKLEEHWELMENDRHKIYGHMSPDEYMDRFGTSELMDDATSLTDEPVAWK